MSTKINTLISRIKRWNDSYGHGKKAWFGNNTLVNDFSVTVFNEVVQPKEELEPMNDKLYENAMNHFNMELNKELEVPNLKELKEELKALVGRNRSELVVYDFDASGDLPRVNARYLIQMMEGLDVYRITCNEENNRKRKPIKLYGKHGTAVLMPMNYFGTDSKGLKRVQ